jgi:two-component system heavy metal sensor histidine kinase CusS
MFSMSRETDGRTWSITTRLIALFTISASTLLFLAMAILYQHIVQHLEEEHEQLLGEIVRVLRHSTASQNLVEQVRNIAAEEPASYSDPYALRVVQRGAVLAESPGMAAIPIDAFSPTPTVLPSGRVRVQRWSSPKGETFLLATIDSDVPGEGWPRRVVQVALNVTRDRLLMRELRVTVWVILLLALVAAALAGAAVVRYSLRPIGRIAAEVADISAEELEQRLPTGGRPRELVGLVKAFNTMLDQLEHAFAGLAQYSANLAHELRNPLNNLRGEAEVALLSERAPAEYREVLISSLEEYERLSNMVDGLLFLARAESHETRLAGGVLSLAELARAVCEFYDGVAEEKQVTLDVTGDASVAADPVLLRRALANLVANSLAHTSAGGHVTVAIAQTEEGGAIVRVEDDGSGISAGDLPHVPERFYRGSQSRGAGSGLGLAIVKSIIELHGGTIDIESEPGRGTVVTLRFPASRFMTTM